ncbi:hypothetical protein [Methanococcoides sp. AM1]|uniref:hypothetical protein n=1 Tax=Methanococcoides sp. AM1 TaxID=1201011 RepID=UPI0010839399|nr:hypothetical protein [Methanococcoides sp. AM1]
MNTIRTKYDKIVVDKIEHEHLSQFMIEESEYKSEVYFSLATFTILITPIDAIRDLLLKVLYDSIEPHLDSAIKERINPYVFAYKFFREKYVEYRETQNPIYTMFEPPTPEENRKCFNNASLELSIEGSKRFHEYDIKILKGSADNSERMKVIERLNAEIAEAEAEHKAKAMLE